MPCVKSFVLLTEDNRAVDENHEGNSRQNGRRSDRDPVFLRIGVEREQRGTHTVPDENNNENKVEGGGGRVRSSVREVSLIYCVRCQANFIRSVRAHIYMPVTAYVSEHDIYVLRISYQWWHSQRIAQPHVS